MRANGVGGDEEPKRIGIGDRYIGELSAGAVLPEPLRYEISEQIIWIAECDDEWRRQRYLILDFLDSLCFCASFKKPRDSAACRRRLRDEPGVGWTGILVEPARAARRTNLRQLQQWHLVRKHEDVGGRSRHVQRRYSSRRALGACLISQLVQRIEYQSTAEAARDHGDQGLLFFRRIEVAHGAGRRAD